MRALALTTVLALGPLGLAADGRTELELLQARCAEQERQITALETEVQQLRERVDFERRRARTLTPANSEAKTASPTPKIAAKEAKSESYVVKGGDTISAISRRYTVSPRDLMAKNGIEDPTRLRVGQKLTIPGPKATDASTAEAKPVEKKAAPATNANKTYSVQSGDTLSRVARIHGMKYSEIVALNPEIKPDRLLVGQKLTITGKAVASRDIVAKEKPEPKPHKVASNKPSPAAKPAAKPEPKPAPQPERAPAPDPGVTLVTVYDEVSFGAFAARHNTTPERLNALNGQRLKSSTVLAKGSVLYVATN